MVRVQWWVPLKKGQIRMNNICMKIVAKASENVIWQIQNNGSRS
jgi:hypothetical protein